jgi:RNA-directed DNA polymerase
VIGPDVFSFEALWHHYRDCRRNKRGTLNALAFELDAEANLLALQAELRERSYRPGTSICFLTGGPKPREVFAADFRDRIVHHLLVHHQERVFEPRFIHDSYACRKGRGTLAASDRLMDFLRRATANGHRGAWALKLDVASFFPSIHKETLYAILQRAIAHPELLWLTRTVLFHDPTADYRYCARPGGAPAPGGPGYPIPATKSLFGKANVRGLPIGNLTSQFWANVYLNELDQFVKRRLGCRLYLRYADDLVLLHGQPEVLAGWGEAVAAFLDERLSLRLRPGPNAPTPVRGGIDFVGWRTWWNHRLPRRRTLGNLQTRLDAFERRAVRPAFSGQARRIALPGRGAACRVERLHAVLASYSGLLRHGGAWRDWAAVWEQHPWLAALFERAGWDLSARWCGRELARASSLSAQYRALLRHAGVDVLVFCQVGRFIELYGPQRLLAQQTLGLKAALLPRAGFAFTAGFPRGLAGDYALRAIRAGLAVVQVDQLPAEWQAGCRPRRPVAVLVPEPLSR